MQGIATIGMLAGGLGLFLLAVNMITDGLRLAAGNALRDILGKWTRSPMHGIFTGITITAIVQSSSAVTVATIGFVNAGLLPLYQALGVIYGTNIGTTMTAWLVAIIGFEIKVNTFALPLIGIGMILRLLSRDSRLAPVGMALAGFGLFFIGIDVLKDTFANLTAAVDLQRFTVDGVAGVILFVGVGFLLTLLTQSSSAAIAITLTAATGGVLGLYAAAAMVIGANVGTTSTAIFSVIGATPNAKRVAAAHVVFNVGTGVVALLILPLLFLVVNTTGKLLGLEDVPAVTLALFHTTFNVLGVLLIMPVSDRLARYLESKFTSLEEIEGRPRHLDKSIAASPALALNALGLELEHVGEIARRMSKAAMSLEQGGGMLMQSDRDAVGQLVIAIGDFISQMERATMPKDISTELPGVLRTSQYYLASADLAMEIAAQQAHIGEIKNDELLHKLSGFRADVVQLLDVTNVQSAEFSVADCDSQLEELNACYDDLKAFLLETGVASAIDIASMSVLLEQNSHARRLVTQMVKAARYLSQLYVIADIFRKPEPEPEPEPEPVSEPKTEVLTTELTD